MTHDDYLKLLALMTLAKQHQAMLDELERTMQALVGEGDDEYSLGWVSDALYGVTEPDPRRAVEYVLKGAKITVEPAEQ